MYDTIVVGSGNGACGFLSYYLEAGNDRSIRERVLVLEEGDDFFTTSDITHQNNWTKSYAEEKVFKLHNALTPKGIPIISGRACTMGGGGSINYTMMHESSEWLATHIGQTAAYWDSLKAELNQKFARPNPVTDPSPVTKQVLQAAEKVGFVTSTDAIDNIPNLEVRDTGLLHLFPTQFNSFGQRTHSGVSIVDWFGQGVEIKTRCRVERLEFSKEQGQKPRCVGVHVKYLDTGMTERLSLLPDGGKVIMCAGGATPRLLWSHREELGNDLIGQHVNDHIVMPLGLYVVDKSIDVTPRDVYISVFATTVWQPEPEQPGQETVCCFDFFSGNFERLWFMIAHLYLAFLFPNWLKKFVIRLPWLFNIIKNVIRVFLQAVNFIINLLWGLYNLLQGKPWHDEAHLITAAIKFNAAKEGCYSRDDSRIELDFFGEEEQSHFNQDKVVANSEIAKHMALLNGLGEQPHWLVKWFLRLVTKMPYEENQIEEYVDVYSRRFLLSEQHLSGGCLFGKAIDKGLDNAIDTGKVYGSANVYVADLSAVPLPRISTQMTAYLIGFHVAKRICVGNGESGVGSRESGVGSQ
ncbi:MAG: choline dehydrogenase [Moorea sp. SIO1G6]|nr:choline dehydrogenase [Moorena sp. SIO4E2]NES81349.1 choline dehydrogenase [Moorena sp. SIO2B7]NET68924.1 choline dehydrogenase [Moorena sp. SIO1G6]